MGQLKRKLFIRRSRGVFGGMVVKGVPNACAKNAPKPLMIGCVIDDAMVASMDWFVSIKKFDKWV